MIFFKFTNQLKKSEKNINFVKGQLSKFTYKQYGITAEFYYVYLLILNIIMVYIPKFTRGDLFITLKQLSKIAGILKSAGISNLIDAVC